MKPNAFWEFEHSGWQRAVQSYHDGFGPLTAQTIPALLEALGCTPGISLLDVAAGPGYVAAAAAQQGAHVVGLDFSSEMVAKARELFPHLSFEEGDAQALPFPDETFEAVVMNFGLLHLGRPEQAIAEAYRVLRHGGRFGFTVWARPQEAVGFQMMLDAVRERGDPQVPLPIGPPFFRFSDEGESQRVLMEAGFANPTVQKLALIWELPSAGALFDAFYAGTARTGGLLRAQAPAALRAVREAVQQAAAAYQTDAGLRIPMPALVITAWKR